MIGCVWNHSEAQSSNARTSWSHGVMMSWWYCWCDDAWYGGCRDVCVIAICIVTMWCADGRATDGGEGWGGGKGEAGDAAPKIRTPHGDVGKNRLKYQHVGCKLQPLEATYVSSCWRPSVQDLFEVDGTTCFFFVTWGQVTHVGIHTMQYTKVAIVFGGPVPLNPIEWY